MKRLSLLRHAKAEPDSSGGDFNRSLNETGRNAAVRIGDEILDLGIQFDQVMASPARRVVETVAGLKDVAPIFDHRIYDASCEQLLDIVQSVEDGVGSLLIVGHNPGIALLTLLLTSDMRVLTDGFSTAAFAQVDLAIDRWHEAGRDKSQLTRFIDPKKLD